MNNAQKATMIIALTSLVTLYGCTDSPRPGRGEPKEDDTRQTSHTPATGIAAPALVEKAALAKKTDGRTRSLLAFESKANIDQYCAVPAVADQITVPHAPGLTTESYQVLRENGFIVTDNDPLSTFSIDVDTASYANVRRYIHGGNLPPAGAVRAEEMINYFSYDYPQPTSEPLALAAELGPAPWNTEHQLVKIGLQAKELATDTLPPSNLVFLVDVSGSMQAENKLPLLQKSLLMLTETLTGDDRLAIVAYAGSDRVILPPTRGDEKEKIRGAVVSLTSGGSTHASSGIMTAYALAEQSFSSRGNNRVILASDGDFNVGVTDRSELKQLIEKKRAGGIYLTVLGFGMGNYHDDTMEILADSGNGNYSYIDSLLEAKKVLIKERAATLYALANDVKIQVEFNPALVGAYRLIGYENRILADEDFRDDSKDAGEIGVGHRVTALYELIPPNSADLPVVDKLRYQPKKSGSHHTNELLTVKLRYKPLGKNISTSLALPVAAASPELEATSDDFHFAAAVAAFAMKLTESTHLGEFGYDQLIALAKRGRGADNEGYRAEFIRLAEMAEMLEHRQPGRLDSSGNTRR